MTDARLLQIATYHGPTGQPLPAVPPRDPPDRLPPINDTSTAARRCRCPLRGVVAADLGRILRRCARPGPRAERSQRRPPRRHIPRGARSGALRAQGLPLPPPARSAPSGAHAPKACRAAFSISPMRTWLSAKEHMHLSRALWKPSRNGPVWAAWSSVVPLNRKTLSLPSAAALSIPATGSRAVFRRRRQ